jgi:zinc finger protein
VIIPELDFEIPPRQTRGAEINTVEGLLMTSADNLQLGQPDRYVDNPDVARRVQEVIDTLRELANGERFPFTIVVDDPSGNSIIQVCICLIMPCLFSGFLNLPFCQNIFAPAKDPFVKVSHYPRSADQNRALGLSADLDEAADQGLFRTFFNVFIC